ncbi:MAG: HYR domain-containing protein [Planctomycetota bacterium]|nr:HYR domain-containing protein [Planctomycetota bacterium]
MTVRQTGPPGRIRIFTTTIAAVLCTVVSPPAVAQSSFSGLGDLQASPPGSGNNTWAFDVSPDGASVVGMSPSGVGAIVQAYRWTEAGGFLDLGGLPGSTHSASLGVSANGLVVVGFGFPSSIASTASNQAFRWTAIDGMVGLGFLAGGDFSRAVGVSADGAVIAGSSSTAKRVEPFRWTQVGGMVGLGTLGGDQAFANDVSNDGSTIVGQSNLVLEGAAEQAFRWTEADGMVGLGDLLGGPDASRGVGVNADGTVVVGLSASTLGTEAFRWTAGGGMVGLGDLPGGSFFSFAFDVSDDGSVIGGESNGGGGGPAGGKEAVIWDAGGVRPLKEVLVDDHGLDLTGWTLFSARAISGDGLTVVGLGFNPAGRQAAWIATIDPTDTDLDGIPDDGDNCPTDPNPDQTDRDFDGLGDACDVCPDDPDGDEDADGVCSDTDNCPGDSNPDQADTDGDGLGDACDPDDDNDTVVDEQDLDPFNPFACRDADLDGCDDCSSGVDNSAEDGVDSDADGLCDLGDPDDDNDGVVDELDSDPLDRFACRDADLDGCDDCSSGIDDRANDGTDTDADGLCDAGDPDVDPPVITCPSILTVETNTNCSFVGGIGSAAATDDFSPPAAIAIANDAPAAFPLGTTLVTWTATDEAGNRSTCVEEVTVSESEPPMITCPPAVTVNTNSGCTFVGGTGDATATDICSVTITNDAPAAFPLGTTLVTWTATDEAGNRSTCVEEVTVVDSKALVITCPPPLTVEANEGCTFVGGIGEVMATDNCSKPGSVTITSDAPDVFPLGVTTVTWTAADEAGNRSMCVQEVTVVDSQGPEITCPAALTVEANAGCAFVGETGSAVATDNCSAPESMTLTSEAPAAFPLGVAMVTWTATDEAGNSSFCVQEVMVVDSTSPVVTCPENLSVECASREGAVVEFQVTAGDDCDDSPTVVSTPASGTLFPVGTTTVTSTATDSSGNNAACTFDVTVVCEGGLQRPGDCNQDGELDISDGICIFGVLFLGVPPSFPCGDGQPGDEGNLALIDWQPDGRIDLSDGVSLLVFLFAGGAPHPLAVPEAGGCLRSFDCPDNAICAAP